MGPVTGVITYLIIWWTVFFAVLPIGVTSQAEAGEVVPGADPGAPVDPRMWFKVGLTSLIAAGFWLVVFLMIHFRVIDLAAIQAGIDESR